MPFSTGPYNGGLKYTQMGFKKRTIFQTSRLNLLIKPIIAPRNTFQFTLN